MTDSRKRPTAFPDGGSDALLAALEARPEVVRLKQALRQLPDIEPDPAVWSTIASRARAENTGESPVSRRFELFPAIVPRFAAAAGLLLAVIAGIVGVNALRDDDLKQILLQNQVASLPVENETILALQARSRQLDPITQRYRSDPIVSAYRYRIADLDSQLSGMPQGHLNEQEAQRLWGQRVALLESLAEIRRARAALQPAVY